MMKLHTVSKRYCKCCCQCCQCCLLCQPSASDKNFTNRHNFLLTQGTLRIHHLPKKLSMTSRHVSQSTYAERSIHGCKEHLFIVLLLCHKVRSQLPNKGLCFCGSRLQNSNNFKQTTVALGACCKSKVAEG